MDITELDVALKYCDRKIQGLLNSRRPVQDRECDEFKRLTREVEDWSRRKTSVEMAMEKIVSDKF